MRKLLQLVLFVALAICQVPGRVVVGKCEMECCKPKVSANQQLEEQQSCCCSFTEVHKHVSNDAASVSPITGEFETFALPTPVHFAELVSVSFDRAPIPHAQGPPGRGATWIPQPRAPPVA